MASCAALQSGAIGTIALRRTSPVDAVLSRAAPVALRSLPLSRQASSPSTIGAGSNCQRQQRQSAGTFVGAPRGSQRGRTVCGIFGLGVPELVVIAGVATVLFGPKQLPELGKNLGKTVKSFQQAAKEFEGEIKKNAEELKEEAKGGVDEFKRETEKEK